MRHIWSILSCPLMARTSAPSRRMNLVQRPMVPARVRAASSCVAASQVNTRHLSCLIERAELDSFDWMYSLNSRRYSLPTLS